VKVKRSKMIRDLFADNITILTIFGKYMKINCFIMYFTI